MRVNTPLQKFSISLSFGATSPTVLLFPGRDSLLPFADSSTPVELFATGDT